MDSAERTRRAGSFGAVAAEYERGRPGYPPESIAWVLGPRPIEVLDIGAGTGKLTDALLAAGHSVTAIEPLPAMRAILAERLPQARVLEATAEDLPLAGASMDAVVVGAAFHWFDQRRALAEIVRVLRAPGTLGLLGNSFDTSVPWVAALRQLLGPPAIDRPGHWPEPEQMAGLFSEVAEERFPHDQRVELSMLRDLASSRSSVAILEPAERADLLAQIDALWRESPELRSQTSVRLQWITRARRYRGVRPG